MEKRSLTLLLILILAYIPYSYEQEQKWYKAEGTVFWDCNGMSCMAGDVPGDLWNNGDDNGNPYYLARGFHAPITPTTPSEHGEHMWGTFSSNPSLQMLMAGTDTYDKYDACGQCILVKNPFSWRPDYKAILMKTSICSLNRDESCSMEYRPAISVSAPGFDNIKYSLANICGATQRGYDVPVDTCFDSQEASDLCTFENNQVSCDCSSIRDAKMRYGCEKFMEWEWTTGTTELEFTVVDCPQGLIDYVNQADPDQKNTCEESGETYDVSETQNLPEKVSEPYLTKHCFIKNCGCGPDYFESWCDETDHSSKVYCNINSVFCEDCSGIWCGPPDEVWVQPPIGGDSSTSTGSGTGSGTGNQNNNSTLPVGNELDETEGSQIIQFGLQIVLLLIVLLQ